MRSWWGVVRHYLHIYEDEGTARMDASMSGGALVGPVQAATREEAEDKLMFAYNAALLRPFVGGAGRWCVGQGGRTA